MKKLLLLSLSLLCMMGALSACGSTAEEAPPAEDAAAEAAAPVELKFDVVVTDLGDGKIAFIDYLKTRDGSLLADAIDKAEALPVLVAEALPQAEADQMKLDLEAMGVVVELTEAP